MKKLSNNKKIKLSSVLATINEEENIARCIESLKGISDEIIIFDEYSTDNTKKIAESLGAKVYLEPHHDIFHITKQKAIDAAKGEWILQMDADEVITPELAKEISNVINMTNDEILNRKPKSEKLRNLFERHQALLEQRDGKLGKESKEIVALFIPRVNMFLNKPLIHAGVYPDGVIRLFKKGKAYLPCRSVHEQMIIDGKVGWMNENLLHYDSPVLKKYLMRLNRYTDLHANELRDKKVSKGLQGLLQYVFIKPSFTFLNLFFRHKGFLDGVNGFLWSFFSALHFPIAYFKYITNEI